MSVADIVAGTNAEVVCESQSLGGTIVRVPVSESDKFYEQKAEMFTKPGNVSYLRVLGIPFSFYKNRSEPLKSGILTDVKATASDKTQNILMLVDKDGTIGYCGPENDLGIIDPDVVLNPKGNSGLQWLPDRVDLRGGAITFVAKGELLAPKSYHAAIHATLPIFFDRPLSINAGMYRTSCKNSLIDGTSQSLRIMVKNSTLDLMTNLIQGLKDYPVILSKNYQNMVNNLNEAPANLHDARTLLNELMLASAEIGRIPKTLAVKSHNHMDLLEAKKEVPLLSPTSIGREMDVVDMLTFYAQQLPSIGSQRHAQTGVFNFFKNRVESKSGKVVPTVDLFSRDLVGAAN